MNRTRKTIITASLMLATAGAGAGLTACANGGAPNAETILAHDGYSGGNIDRLIPAADTSQIAALTSSWAIGINSAGSIEAVFIFLPADTSRESTIAAGASAAGLSERIAGDVLVVSGTLAQWTAAGG